MHFTYRGLKRNKIVTGKIEADDLNAAIKNLKDSGYFPIEVKTHKSTGSFLDDIFSKANFNDVVDFTRQLAIMLNAGLTLIDCFDILKKQINKPALLKIVEDLDQELQGGKSFSEGLRKYPHLFPSLYIALVRSGEASGKLSEILLKLADNLEKQREFRGKIKGALIYPVIVVIGMVIVMFIMMTFVLPKLLTLYSDFKVELPLTTRILIIMSSFSAKFWPLIVAGTIGAVFLLKSYLGTKPGKLTKDTLMLKLPVIKNVVKMSALVDSTRTLSILIGSGVSILDGLNIIIETSENVIFERAFKNIYKQVEKGISLGESMEVEGVFPPILVQMATVGEQTGHLDDTLMRISKYFELESELAVKAMTTLIEPMILIFLGVGVGFLVISVITPIYNLTNSFS